MALTLLPAPSQAAPAEALNFPELAQSQTLPAIVHALRDHLVDPNSITNLMVCDPPTHVEVVDGKPARWTIMLALNSRNSVGGYAGVQQVAAIFQAGKPVSIVSLEVPPSAKQLATCTRVPDAEVRRMLGQ